MTILPMQSAVFMGSKLFGLTILKALIAAEPTLKWTIIHPDDASDPRSAFDAFKDFAKLAGVPLKYVENRVEAEDVLAKCVYDVGFVCGWYWLLSDNVVGADARPVYGIHNSLLPRYRGGAPLVWSILKGEFEVGGSLFRLTPGMDDGDIALQVKVAVEQNENIARLLEKIEARFLEEIPVVWNGIVTGCANLIKQDHALATYCAQRRPEDGQIDWSNTSQNIHNFIRAQSNPYPGAFTFCDGNKVYVDRAEVFSGQYYGRPGQIVDRKPNVITVTTGGSAALHITQAHDASGETELLRLFRAGVRVLGDHQENILS